MTGTGNSGVQAGTPVVAQLLLAAAVALSLILAGATDAGAARDKAAAEKRSKSSSDGHKQPNDKAQDNNKKTSPDLAGLAATEPDRRVVTIAMFDGDTSQREAVRLVRRAGGKVGARLPLIRGLAVSMKAREAKRLSARGAVRAVALNSRVEPQGFSGSKLATTYPTSVRADEAWTTLGVTGKNVGVAVIDTGIAGNLADFRISGSSESRVVESAVVHPYATTAGDSYGHGTHVAGIIAGNGNNRDKKDPLVGQYIGIAPEANLISIKASDEAGDTTILDVIYGLQFAVDHRSDWNIRVVNLSLESTVAQSYLTDPLAAAVEAAWFKGLVVVAAAGNRSTSSDAVSYSPGNDPFVISVGATDDRGTLDKSDDVPASWTSRGVTQDGVSKPDIYAPGSRIVAPLAPGSAFTQLCPACVVGGEYIRAGGTSMSAPVVSGAVALILQAYPQLTPNQIKGLLQAYGRKLPKEAFPRDVFQVDPVKVIGALRSGINPNSHLSNQGLTPSGLIDPTTGTIDYSRASWRRASWRTAQGDLRAGWARASWRCDCSTLSDGSVDTSRASWRRTSWSTEWTK